MKYMKNNKLNIILNSINSIYVSYVFNYINNIEAGNVGSEGKYKEINGDFCLPLFLSILTSSYIFLL